MKCLQKRLQQIMGIKTFLYILLGLSLFIKCTSYKKIVYFNDLQDSLPKDLSIAKTDFNSKIEKNDYLNIRITSLNPQDAQIFNPGSAGSSASPSNILGSAYQVDQAGNISIALIGSLKAEGLTREELEKHIMEKLTDYLKDPMVSVRYANSKITILGDVNRPVVIRPETERFTILDALGEASDLKVTAKRDNILVIRETNGKRTTGRLDLRSTQIFKSPYFYLQPNDIIYVEPVKASFIDRNDFVSKYIGVAASLVTLIISIVLLTRH